MKPYQKYLYWLKSSFLGMSWIPMSILQKRVKHINKQLTIMSLHLIKECLLCINLRVFMGFSYTIPPENHLKPLSKNTEKKRTTGDIRLLRVHSLPQSLLL